MQKKKFGLCGTSCSGKTTLSYALLSRLKKYSVLADTVSNLDRTFCWDIKYIETELAQNWHITNLISKEVDRLLRDDVEVLITDRTPLDLFAYYCWQYSTELSKSLWSYVKEWMKTYDTIYYLSPLPYQADSKRPTDEFRLGVDTMLLQLMKEIPNVVTISRKDVLQDILSKINMKKPGTKHSITDNDMQCFANQLNLTLVLKEQKNQDSISDQDLFIIGKADREKVYSFIRHAVGPHVDFDVLLVPSGYELEFEHKIFKPQL